MPRFPRPVSRRKAIGPRKKGRRRRVKLVDHHIAADNCYSTGSTPGPSTNHIPYYPGILRPASFQSYSQLSDLCFPEGTTVLLPIKDCNNNSGWKTAWENFYVKDSNQSASIPNSYYKEVTDSDNCTANEFYVVLHKVFQYAAEDELDVVVSRLLTERACEHYRTLLDEVKLNWRASGGLTFFSANHHGVRFIQAYDHEPSQAMRLNLIINQSLQPTLYVHGKKVDCDHDFWTGLPHIYKSVKDIQKLQSKLERWDICMGNYEAQYVSMVQSGVSVHKNPSWVSAVAYREGIDAVRGDIQYESTIRSTKCRLLVLSKRRCKHCALYRNTLRKKASRQKAQTDSTFSLKNTPQSMMNSPSG